LETGKLKINKIVFTASVVFLLASPAFAALKLNEYAPSFSLRDMKGRDFNLSDVVGPKSREKANGVILSFFASWCLECRSELPLINSLVDELKGKGIEVVIVDVKEDFDTINALLAEMKVDKPVVLSDRRGKTAEMYGVRFLPVTFFIGADARVKHIIFGKINDAKELRESAGKLLQ
jgi:thiol-disulfide isomerase/thioredoxin